MIDVAFPLMRRRFIHPAGNAGLDPTSLSGLLAYYKLNEGSGTALTDSSGNGYHGATRVTGGVSPTGGNLTNAVTWTAQGIAFNGTNQGAWLPGDSLLSAKTVMLFCSTVPTSSSQSILWWQNNTDAPYLNYAFAMSGLDGRPVLDVAGYGDAICGTPVPIYGGAASLTWTLAGGIGTVAASGVNRPKLYINGAETPRYLQVHAADVVSGQGGHVDYVYLGCAYPLFRAYTGIIYTIITFNRVLTAAEVQGVHVFVASALALRGVSLSATTTPDPSKKLIIFDGDSIARGYSATTVRRGGLVATPEPRTLARLVAESLSGSYNWLNVSMGGQTSAEMAAMRATYIDPIVSGFTNNVALVFMIGTNDNFSDSEFASVMSYGAAAKSIGVNALIAVTGLPRTIGSTANEARRQAWNTRLRTDAGLPKDAVADWGNDANMGQFDQESSTVLYSDHTHPTGVPSPSEPYGYQLGASYVVSALTSLGYA